MSRPIGVIIFDRDEGQLARRVERVTAERAARDDPDEFRIIGASRRCELLLEADRLPSSVALIDLRADDRDIQARGFGPIETVRRHARLSRRCRPVAWTAWSSHLTADWARRVGAYALVDHDLVFRGEASVLGLVTRVSRQAAVPISEQITFEYHTFSRASPEEEERARWERQERVLGEPWQPGDEELLPRIALGEGFRAIHKALPRRGREAIRKRFNALNKASRTTALGPERGLGSVQALEAFGQPSRAPALSPLTDRPEPLDTARWWLDEDIRRCAYNAEDEIAALREYARRAGDVVGELRRRAMGRWSEESVIERETRLTERVAVHLDAHGHPNVTFDEASWILYRGLRNLQAAAIEVSEKRRQRI